LTRSIESTLSDDENENIDDENDGPQKYYAFPELDKRIRECVLEFDAVFPKLNFSSPKVRCSFIF
jgi:D123